MLIVLSPPPEPMVISPKPLFVPPCAIAARSLVVNVNAFDRSLPLPSTIARPTVLESKVKWLAPDVPVQRMLLASPRSMVSPVRVTLPVATLSLLPWPVIEEHTRCCRWATYQPR